MASQKPQQHDAKPAGAVETAASDARSGEIRGRVIMVLAVSTVLAFVALVWAYLHYFSPSATGPV